MWNFIAGIYLGYLLRPLIELTIEVLVKIFKNAYKEYKSVSKEDK